MNCLYFLIFSVGLISPSLVLFSQHFTINVSSWLLQVSVIPTLEYCIVAILSVPYETSFVSSPMRHVPLDRRRLWRSTSSYPFFPTSRRSAAFGLLCFLLFHHKSFVCADTSCKIQPSGQPLPNTFKYLPFQTALWVCQTPEITTPPPKKIKTFVSP